MSLAEQCSVNSGLGLCVVTGVGGGYFGNIVCDLVFVVTASFSSRTVGSRRMRVEINAPTMSRVSKERRA